MNKDLYTKIIKNSLGILNVEDHPFLTLGSEVVSFHLEFTEVKKHQLFSYTNNGYTFNLYFIEKDGLYTWNELITYKNNIIISTTTYSLPYTDLDSFCASLFGVFPQETKMFLKSKRKSVKETVKLKKIKSTENTKIKKSIEVENE